MIVAANPTKFKTVVSPNGFLWTMVMLNVTMGQVTGEEMKRRLLTNEEGRR